MSDGIQQITFCTMGLYQSGLKRFSWITLWFWKGYSEEISPTRPRESVVTRLTNLSSDLGSTQRGEVKTVFLKGFLICRLETIGSHSHATAFHLWPFPPAWPPPRAPLPVPRKLTDATVRSGESWGAFTAKPVHAVYTDTAVVAAEKRQEKHRDDVLPLTWNTLKT